MIPKIIHYCWFGKKPLSHSMLAYINGWREKLPDYKIIEWNESTFDVYSNEWTKNSYNAKKYAFVADYVRIYALFQMGGIYLDTDVQVLKSFDPFLKYHTFMSFEGDENLIGTAVIGSEKKMFFLKELLDFYNNNSFNENTLGALQNTTLLQKILLEKGLRLDNSRQTLKDGIEMFPMDYFSAKNVHRDEYHITENTVCIHQYNMSWFDPRHRLWIKFANRYIKPVKRFLGLLPPKYQ